MKLRLSVCSGTGCVRWAGEAEDEIWLSWRGRYEAGDALVLEAEVEGVWLWLQLDICLEPSLVLMAQGRLVFSIPFGERRVAYGKGWAFEGERHWAHARVADAREISSWRNLALNAHDVSVAAGATVQLFPHAQTNVVCGNPQFWARNAIDGVFDSSRHGSWPHASWGVAGKSEAVLVLSDGTSRTLALERTGRCQRFMLGGAKTEWLRLEQLEKGAEEGFAALSQIEVWGTPVLPEGGSCDAQ